MKAKTLRKFAIIIITASMLTPNLKADEAAPIPAKRRSLRSLLLAAA